MSSSNVADAEAKKEYVREKQLHHLFELLASKALEARPANIFKFLRETLEEIEKGESRAHKHDPSQILFDRAPTATAGGAAAGASDAAAAGGSKPSPQQPQQGPLKMTLAVFGLDNAGKSALIAAMGGNVDPNTTPTVGFSPSIFETAKIKLCVFDLGGGRNFRGIWPHYYHDCHGCIYVIDSADTTRLEEATTVLHDVSRHKFMQGKPLLVFANKSDVAGAKSVSEIQQRIKLDPSMGTDNVKFMPCCAIKEDPNIDEGVDWLLAHVEKNYAELSTLVSRQCAEFKEEKKRKMEEQQRRVEAQKKLDALA